MRYIYALIDPIENDIRYIGQTKNIEKRLKSHISSSMNEKSKSYNTHKSNWIRKLINNGHTPIIEMLEECESLIISNEKEKYYIETLTNEGIKLTNSYVNDVTDLSEITKQKISKSRKGKKLEEIVGVDKARELKEYYSKRLKIDNPNKSNEIDVRMKISNSLKEFFSNKENHWAYGLKMNEEHNEKLRLAKLGNKNNVGNRLPRTKEQKKIISDKIKGTKVKRSPILQYDLNMELIKEWPSIRGIVRTYSTMNRQSISDTCKNLRESYAGFIWKYK